MLDLSANKDFAALANIVAELQTVAAPLAIDFILIGATARDVMLKAHRLETARATADVDFAFMVQAWEQFDALRAALLASGRFTPHERDAVHKLRHAGTGYQLDIVPFGALENSEREVALPPGSGMKFNCFGIREAYAVRVPVILPGAVRADVASIPALAVLKLAAFNDRKRTAPGKDASDLLLLTRKYLDCGDNMDRLFSEHEDLTAGEPDTDIYGARLLARDIAHIAAADLGRLIAILTPEIDPHGELTLARQTGAPGLERVRAIFAALTQELQAQSMRR